MTSDTRVFSVPSISCDHCKNAIETELGSIDAIQSVTVDVDSKTVAVAGGAADEIIVAGIEKAGYQVA